MSGSFGIGSALGTATRWWVRNLPACVVFAIAGYAPLLALFAVTTYTPLASRAGSLVSALLEVHPVLFQQPVGALYAVAFALGAAAVTWRTVTALDGARASLGPCLLHAFRRAPAIAAVTIVAYLGVHGVRSAVDVLVLADARFGVPISVPAMLASQVLELVLGVGFVLALAVAVSERHGVFAAIARGWRLSAGVRWKLFVLLLVFAVASMLLHVLLRQLLSAWASDGARMRERFAIVHYVSIALSLLLMTVRATVFAVAYAQLRADREGPTRRELARVFD